MTVFRRGSAAIDIGEICGLMNFLWILLFICIIFWLIHKQYLQDSELALLEQHLFCWGPCCIATVVSWPTTIWGPVIVIVRIVHLSVCLSHVNISKTRQDRHNIWLLGNSNSGVSRSLSPINWWQHTGRRGGPAIDTSHNGQYLVFGAFVSVNILIHWIILLL